MFIVNTLRFLFERSKGIVITNTFQQLLDESNRKPKQIWIDKGRTFCNRSIKSWLQYNNIEMY